LGKEELVELDDRKVEFLYWYWGIANGWWLSDLRKVEGEEEMHVRLLLGKEGAQWWLKTDSQNWCWDYVVVHDWSMSDL